MNYNKDQGADSSSRPQNGQLEGTLRSEDAKWNRDVFTKQNTKQMCFTVGF